MASHSASPVIRLRGVRHNNLKGFDLDLPQNRLIVITGLSGSGKSSLAFDTLFAEGQRRYIETFTPYARQFFDRMDKPRVDSIEGIPPAIAIEQRNAVRTSRSTVGTMTEICDYLKVLWPHLAQLHCSKCGRLVRKDAPPAVWKAMGNAEGSMKHAECLVTFDVPLSEKWSFEDSLALLARQGYQRLLVDGRVVRIEELRDSRSEIRDPKFEGQAPIPDVRTPDSAFCILPSAFGSSLTVVQDRLRLAPGDRARFIEACEQAYHFGKGRLAVRRFEPSSPAGRSGVDRPPDETGGPEIASPKEAAEISLFPFSNRLHCAACNLEFREPTPALFSYNHPLGACPKCKGFGRVIEIDYRLAIPDRTRTLAGGAVKPWQSGMSAECQSDLRKFCRARDVPLDVPFQELSEEHQRWVLEGDPDYGADEEHEWPRAWYGVKGYFRWLESKAYKMHVRVLLSRYRAYTTCPDCGGKRLKPEALQYRLALPDDPQAAPGVPDAGMLEPGRPLTLADLYALPVRDAYRVAVRLGKARPRTGGSAKSGGPTAGATAGAADPVALALEEVRARLGYLVEVGLGYLTLDRATRTLSGGETERVNLTTCLGSRLVNTLFVLDEPSVGLHARDTDRLIRILERLRDAGNTVVVVEHEASVMRAADQVVDLGPGHGETGGQLVFQGSCRELLQAPDSLTGLYLAGRRKIEVPERRPVSRSLAASVARAPSRRRETPEASRPSGRLPMLSLRGVTRHNLRDLAVDVPLSRFVVITGVSGSGKSTLARQVLFPALEARLRERMAASQPTGEPATRGGESESGGDPDPASSASESAEANGAMGSRLAIEGWEALGRVVMVDQAPLGRTPRSNPAVYIGAFDEVRELFATSEMARERGLKPSAFSFNSTQGQCERCRGAGFEKIEMQFLSDVFIRCPDCDGRRYRQHVLECRMQNAECRNQAAAIHRSPRAGATDVKSDDGGPSPEAGWSIADLLEASVDEAVRWLGGFDGSRHARRAIGKLQLLVEVGLGYLRLGQPINTLSGGESQRLKLAAHLAEAVDGNAKCKMQNAEPESASDEEKGSRASGIRHPASGIRHPGSGTRPQTSDFGFRASDFTPPSPTLFLFDEPTTGLHFEDVRVLLDVFQRLVDAGHSVIVIEHNLEVIKCADWVIDLGPEAGDEGGQLVVAGTPEDVAACEASHTGTALRGLGIGKPARRQPRRHR